MDMDDRYVAIYVGAYPVYYFWVNFTVYGFSNKKFKGDKSKAVVRVNDEIIDDNSIIYYKNSDGIIYKMLINNFKQNN